MSNKVCWLVRQMDKNGYFMGGALCPTHLAEELNKQPLGEGECVLPGLKYSYCTECPPRFCSVPECGLRVLDEEGTLCPKHETR
jgi:hypothetical protein